MSVDSVLLFAAVDNADPARGPAACAIALARAHGARLTVLVLDLDVTTPGRTTDPAAAAAAVRAAAEAAGLDVAVVGDHSHAIGVHEVVCEHARLHDLTVAGCTPGALLGERGVVEHLLFESGRPVMVVPADWTGEVAGALAVAWDNTRAAARALADARPLARDGEAVLLTIDGDKRIEGDLSPAQAVAVLARRGLAVRAVNAARGNRDIGDALQQEALSAGAAVLAMGGYGHSRLRRFVLGGATEGVLRGPKLPVLLSH